MGGGLFSRRPSSQRSLTSFLQVDLAGLCLRAGVKNLGTVFLMTDAQVADEKFLVFINDLLASGKRLFALEYLQRIPAGVRVIPRWRLGTRSEEQGHRNEGENRYRGELVREGPSRTGAGSAVFHCPHTAEQAVVLGLP